MDAARKDIVARSVGLALSVFLLGCPMASAADDRPSIRDLAAPRSLAAADAPTSGAPAGTVPGEERSWSSFLPLLADEARRRGYALPPPFGVSVIYNYLARDIEITDVRVGVNGEPLRSVSEVADFGARSTVNAALVKADAWLLPFANLYVLLGYIDNVADTNIRVTVPRPGPVPGRREFTITKTTKVTGLVGGGGLTLAGGYRQFFATADANYTQSDLGFDDRFRALIVSARVGWNGLVGPMPLRLWVGGAYWDTANTAKATVDVPEVGRVQFEADQGPRRPWNMTVGASAVLHRHFEAFAEYGFNPGDVTILVGGLTLRF